MSSPRIEDDFPEFYRLADQYSGRWQSRYLWTERVQIIALLLATAVAALGLQQIFVVLLFGGALVAQLYRLTSRSAEKWWNGRAGAESAKTTAWRFVVGGEPFGISNKHAESQLARRILGIARDVAEIVPIPVTEAYVTDEMRSLRSRPLANRVETYQSQRIADQRAWYARKSAFNSRRGALWALAGVLSSGLALGFGILATAFRWNLDAVGLFSAAGISIAAWTAVKQYQTLGRSYAVASAELAAIATQIESNSSWTDDDWAQFVEEAEEAISREHVSWCASRDR